jgi:hypothetical protein
MNFVVAKVKLLSYYECMYFNSLSSYSMFKHCGTKDVTLEDIFINDSFLY